MPDDVRALLEGIDAPPMHVDPETVVTGGRRRRRRRARAGAGVLVVAVAALALGAAAVRDAGYMAVPPASAISTTASTPTPTPSTDASAPRPVTSRVALDVGHCWVEDVVFDGQTWGLTDADQFGRGGDMPLPWDGTGVMVRLSADRASYTDDAGTVLEFLPVDDPTVFRQQGRGCA